MSSTLTYPQKLAACRLAMRTHHIDFLVVPPADPHLSEYLPEHFQTYQWLSGFTGSVATLVITQDWAGCWVDSRYWEQADIELGGSEFTVQKVVSPAQSGYVDWLAEQVQSHQVLAINGQVCSLALYDTLSLLAQQKQATLKTDVDVFLSIWTDRPTLPSAPIFEHPHPFAATTRADKLAATRRLMAEKQATHHVISALDDIAWLLNLRGSDVNYNPIFLSHFLIDAHQATLFVSEQKLTADLRQKLADDGVRLADYATLGQALQQLPDKARLLLNAKAVTYAVKMALPASVQILDAINPCTLLKSQKADTELAFVRLTMEQDGAALCEFFAWLEKALADKEIITELDIDEKITAARARRPHFLSPSFGTIAGWNGNGAMPHYRATPQSHATIIGDGLLLIDSGGQYLGGTTDITRVVAVGQVNDKQKRDFTLVLKGLIGLSMAHFPVNTLSPMLDALARAPLWAAHIDFNHGTGHGVGYCLNVHEGPQSISRNVPNPNMAMKPGMITSIEPGIYRPNLWGIRLENLAANVVAGQSEFGDYLHFETLTLCPLDTRAIDKTLLTSQEVAWLNDYHETVKTRLLPWVTGDAEAWLKHSTQAI